MMALCQLHSRRPQGVCLEVGLDALGDYLQRCCSQQRGKAVQPRRRRLVGRKLGDEQRVDLDEVEVAACEQCQIRAGESCVIECDSHTGGCNAVERVKTQLVRYTTLRNFEYQLLRARA